MKVYTKNRRSHKMFNHLLRRGFELTLAGAAALIFTYPFAPPVSANETDSPAIADPSMIQNIDCVEEIEVVPISEMRNRNDNPHIADPSMVQDSDYFGEMVIELPVSETIPSHENAPLSSESSIAYEGDLADGMILIYGEPAEVDANKFGTSNPNTVSENDNIGEMLVTTLDSGNKSPNDDPRIDDPSKVDSDDQHGELVVVISNPTTVSTLAFDTSETDKVPGSAFANADPDADPDEAKDDWVGEMVLVATDQSVDQDVEITNDNVLIYQFIGSIFLPIVNH